MKQQILAFCFALGILSASANISKTITLNEAGILSTSLSEVEKATINDLIIIGYIDARDINCLQKEMIVLEWLDIGSALILSYTGTGGTVPSNTYYPADELPQFSFNNNSTIKGVKLPASLVSIGENAFKSTTITGTITIPGSVTSIGKEAFYYCPKLTAFVVEPANTRYSSENGIIYSVNKDTLFKCPSGKNGNLIISNSVKNIGNSAFYMCDSLTGNITIPNSVKSIGEKAFYFCRNFSGSLTLSDSLTSLSKQAFSGCSKLTGTVIFPGCLTFIGDFAFSFCTKLNSFLVEPTNSRFSSENGVIYSLHKDTLLLCPPGKTGDMAIPNTAKCIGKSAFHYCNSFTGNLTIPNSVKSILDNAFYGCEGFKEPLKLPKSMISISNGSFAYSGFTDTLELPNSIMSINNSAFNGCTGLTSLILPNSIHSIGMGAFWGCSGLTSIYTYSNTPVAFGNNSGVFTGVDTAACILYVPYGCKNSYEVASQWNDFLHIVEMSPSYAIAESKSNNVKISASYPNIFIDGTVFGETISIFSINGTQIYSCKSKSDHVILPIQKAGVYLVKVGNTTLKVVL